MRFGLILAQLAILKKRAQSMLLLRVFCYVFVGKKKYFKNIVAFALKSGKKTKKKFLKFYI
jgi:hypothetical protein